jgi:transcriptional regulator with PAS, ATPase and Fis domain
LFLDEVGDLSLVAQAKLLRALQDLAVERVGGNTLYRINTRVVAATNKKLSAAVDTRTFRADLFYRLSGIEIHVPPLRERREDILELAAYFLDRHGHSRRLTLSRAAADVLLTYAWPGNVRELERMMERTVALTRRPVIEVEDLPIRLCDGFGDVLLPSVMRNDTLRAWGSRYVRLVLERSGRNKRKACRALGISYHTLQAYLRYSHGLQTSEVHETPPEFS